MYLNGQGSQKRHTFNHTLDGSKAMCSVRVTSGEVAISGSHMEATGEANVAVGSVRYMRFLSFKDVHALVMRYIAIQQCYIKQELLCLPGVFLNIDPKTWRLD